MSKVNFDYDLFDSKIGYDSYNKLYLIRVYDLLVFEMCSYEEILICLSSN